MNKSNPGWNLMLPLAPPEPTTYFSRAPRAVCVHPSKLNIDFGSRTPMDCKHVALTLEDGGVQEVGEVAALCLDCDGCPIERVVWYCMLYSYWIMYTLDEMKNTFDTLYLKGSFPEVRSYIAAAKVIFDIGGIDQSKIDKFSEYARIIESRIKSNTVKELVTWNADLIVIDSLIDEIKTDIKDVIHGPRTKYIRMSKNAARESLVRAKGEILTEIYRAEKMLKE
tara:strand:- start:1553 stop:2224 length:672 start_codon:yes stop_codon:yes gene_type:complete